MIINFRYRPAVLPVQCCLLTHCFSFVRGDYGTNTVPFFFITH